jgi:hypothetical protein
MFYRRIGLTHLTVAVRFKLIVSTFNNVRILFYNRRAAGVIAFACIIAVTTGSPVIIVIPLVTIHIAITVVIAMITMR